MTKIPYTFQLLKITRHFINSVMYSKIAISNQINIREIRYDALKIYTYVLSDVIVHCSWQMYSLLNNVSIKWIRKEQV